MPGTRLRRELALIVPRNAAHVWPGRTPRPVDPVVLGTASAPIDNDTWANCCILLQILAKTQPERVQEFFNLRGDRHDKIAFLMKHAHFDTWGKQ